MPLCFLSRQFSTLKACSNALVVTGTSVVTSVVTSVCISFNCLLLLVYLLIYHFESLCICFVFLWHVEYVDPCCVVLGPC